jgi:hypothetical protein
MRLGIPGRGPRRGDARYAVHEFVRDIDSSRFARGGWPIATMLVTLGAAWIAAHAGIVVGLAIIAAGTVALLVALVAERQRWRAQDMIHGYQAARIAEWVRNTGSEPVPYFDVAANEVWLGAHQRGTVPQIYRAHAAEATGDPAVIARELAALPDDTPLDRANRLWVLAGTWDLAATRDLSDLQAAVSALPEGEPRSLFEGYFAHVESLRRHRAGARDWLEPLATAWASFPRPRLGMRRSARIWFSRFWPAAWFAAFGVIFVFALSPLWAATIPADYAKTELSTRGDLPTEPRDWNDVWLTLPGIADALPAAHRSGGVLDQDSWGQQIVDGMPTVIWDVRKISLTPPSDAAGRAVTQLEVLLGSSSAEHGWVLVTFDTTDGPTYLYDLSPAAVRALQDVIGVVPSGG